MRDLLAEWDARHAAARHIARQPALASVLNDLVALAAVVVMLIHAAATGGWS